MANAIKITPYGGSDIYFDEHEVHRLKVHLGKSIQVQTNQVQPPRAYDTIMSHENRYGITRGHNLIMSIDIFHYYGTTKANLTTLFSAGTSFTVYYCLIDDDSKNYAKMLLDPNYSEFYFYGEQSARIITKLNLYRGY